jgi:hypothetical protein
MLGRSRFLCIYYLEICRGPSEPKARQILTDIMELSVINDEIRPQAGGFASSSR